MPRADAAAGDHSASFRSLTIDDLQVGDAVELTRQVSLEDIQSFAKLSGDYNPVHVDVAFARASRFGRPIAHGPVALGLAGGIVGTRLPGLGTIAISSSIRHYLPIFADDRVTTRVVVSDVDREAKRVTLALTWTNQEGQLLGDGETVVSPPRKRVPAPMAAGRDNEGAGTA